MAFCKVSHVEDGLLRALPLDLWERVLRFMGEPCPMIHCHGVHWLRIPIRHGFKGQRFYVEQSGSPLAEFFCVSLRRLHIYVQVHPWMPSINVVDRVLLTWAGGFGSCYDMAKAAEELLSAETNETSRDDVFFDGVLAEFGRPAYRGSVRHWGMR